MSLPIHIPIAYNSRVFRQRFSNILYPFKLISNCIEKCGSSDPTESGSSVPDTILIMLSQSTVEPRGRCIKTIYWRQYNLHANNTDTYTDIITHVLHSEYYTFTKHKIISHGSQKLSFLTETEMTCGNAL